ncbi:hypothetical protein CMV_015472 [Castanea mollissima]|uniref:Uncharacterized protein n=1 Tax=Castanea mollissima TaxID=60419 RepID=A0A8J4VFZ6_9ROSI|nr:hypothetical protein CMV_015472 [Castanea mollissima]
MALTNATSTRASSVNCDTLPDNSSAKALVAIDFNGFQLAAPTLDGFIDQLPDLAIFHANTNNFSGTISPKISNLPYFYELDISNSRIFGVFPQALLGNSLTGCLPWEIGLLKNATVFYVSFNQLIGPIPQSFQCLFNIGLLNLARNQFYGEVPEAVCKLPNLYNFSLSYNCFTQVCPICRK